MEQMDANNDFPIYDAIDLTTSQFSVWFAQLLDPPSPIFNLAEYTTIHGDIDRQLFASALALTIQELKTPCVRFAFTDERPIQMQGETQNFNFFCADLSAHTDPEREAVDWFEADRLIQPDLYGGNLSQFALFRIAAAKYVFYQRCHHLLADGASAQVLLRRLFEIYSDLTTGQPYQPSAPGTWRDIALADKEYPLSQRYQKDRAYWLNELQDLPATVTVSGKRPCIGRRFHARHLHLPEKLSNEIRSRAAALGAGARQWIAACAALHVSRRTGQNDLILGLPVTARVTDRTKTAFGFASNVVPLRLKLANASFESLVDRTGIQMRSALRHQLYRTEYLRGDLGLSPKDPSVFAMNLNFFSFDYNLRCNGHRITQQNMTIGPVEDLSLVVFDRLPGDQMRVSLYANADNYDEISLKEHHEEVISLLVKTVDSAPGTDVHRLLHSIRVPVYRLPDNDLIKTCTSDKGRANEPSAYSSRNGNLSKQSMSGLWSRLFRLRGRAT